MLPGPEMTRISAESVHPDTLKLIVSTKHGASLGGKIGDIEQDIFYVDLA